MALDFDGSVDQSMLGDDVERVPDTSDTVLARGALKMRSLRSPRALAFVVSVLLVTIGVGTTVAMRPGLMDGLGSTASVINADDAAVQQAKIAAGGQKAPLSLLGAGGSSNQPVVAAATTGSTPPVNAVIPTPPTTPIVARNLSSPDPPQAAAESSMFGTPHRVPTVSVKPDATIVSKDKPEMVPLPPTKPRTLASAATTTLVSAADATGSVTSTATKGADTTRAKQLDTSANADGPSSFSIQLASSLSKGEALATLSRLRKQFPGALRGGSISRADAGSNGVFYRVQVKPLSRTAADKVCSQLKAGGENCIVTRS